MQPPPGPLCPDDMRFAELVVSHRLCAKDRVDECVAFIARLASEGVTPVPRLAELLVRKGYLTSADVTIRAAAAPEAPAEHMKLPPEAARAARDPACLLGKYVKVSRLGAGGMGEVWKGWDRELGRWVALKFLHDPDPAQRTRLLREARTAGALNHPNIASVYEVGAKDGAPFIAMQYVEGETLATFPRTDRRALVALVQNAALAVQHAHEQGIVHRDLKPANLMVEHGRVFVMDFGLAKTTALDGSLSVSGSIVGTPAYMPPEQARGGAGAVSPACDVYSLGATLYELLSDRPPFQSSDLYALLREVVDDDPRPPRSVKPSIDRDLETIVLKCLEKEPARRYGAARELADDLGRWLRDEPILAHPPSALYRARKFVLRRKALIAIGAAGLAAVALSLAILVPSWLHERTLKELAPLRTQIAVVREWVRQPFRKPEEIHRALSAEIDAVSAYVARHPDLPQGFFVRAQARLYLGDLRGAEKDAREALRLDPGFLPGWTLLGRARLEVYAGLLSAERIEPFKVREDLARAVLAEARESLRRGRPREGDRGDIEAWGLSRTRDDAVTETLAEALHHSYVRGSAPDALRRLREAHRRSPSEEYLLWASRCVPFGEEKDRLIRETLEMAPHYALGHVERGNALADAGESAAAIRAYTDAIARDPRSSPAFIARGLVRGAALDLRGAIEDFTEVLRLDPRDTSAYVYRGAARSMAGETDGAIADCGAALEIHPESVGALINRSIARRNKKDYPGALADLARVHAINPKIPHAWTNQAGVRQEMNDMRGALDDVSRAIEVDGAFREAYEVRGILRYRTNDLEGSIRDFTRGIELLPAKGSSALRARLYGQRCMSRLTKGDVEGGMADALEALRLDPDKPATLAWHAGARLAKGETEEAIRAYSRVIELDPTFVDAWTGRAQARLFRGLLAEAIDDASRAVEIDPGNTAGFMTRAVARQRRRDFAGAEDDCGKALASGPETGEAYLVRSYCRAALGRFQDAIADAGKAQGLFPPGAPQGELARKWGEAYRAGKLP